MPVVFPRFLSEKRDTPQILGNKVFPANFGEQKGRRRNPLAFLVAFVNLPTVSGVYHIHNKLPVIYRVYDAVFA